VLTSEQRVHVWLSRDGREAHWCLVNADQHGQRRCVQEGTEGAMHNLATQTAYVEFLNSRRMTQVGSPHYRVKYRNAYDKQRQEYERFVSNEQQLDAFYSTFAFYCAMNGTALQEVLHDRLPTIAHAIRRRLQRLTEVALLPSILQYVSQWTLAERFDELRTLLDFTTVQVNVVRLGRPEGELFTDLIVPALLANTATNVRQPVAVRFRCTNGEVISIEQARDSNLITQSDYDVALRQNMAIDELVLRAYRNISVVQVTDVLVTYVCPYQSPTKSSYYRCYEDKVKWLRRTYPLECLETSSGDSARVRQVDAEDAARVTDERQEVNETVQTTGINEAAPLHAEREEANEVTREDAIERATTSSPESPTNLALCVDDSSPTTTET
jgi:hypothetical protein